MKKSFAIVFGLSVLAFLDSLLSYAFPFDFQYQRVSIVWHCFFIGVMVFVHDKPWKTRILIGALAGILLDYLFNDSFPVSFLTYPVYGFLIGFFEPWMYRTKVAFLIYMIFCFLADWIPYIMEMQMGLLHIGFWKWFLYAESVTMIANAFSIFAIVFVDLVMVRFFLIQKHLKVRESRRKMKKLRSSL